MDQDLPVSDPIPQDDPVGYLSLRKFSRRIVCPRTGLPVSFADIGDPDGVPLLWLLPSGCSRWIAVPQDPLVKKYGIRLIAIDRPGLGAVPMVPLKDRIQSSCEMTVSVFEHLQLKMAHLLVTSGGIYYAMYLLKNHPELFLSGLNPPPSLYLVAPWSPLLPSDHPDYYSSPFAWIPGMLIETQHLTLPHVMKLANGTMSLWSSSTTAFNSGLDMAKSFFSSQQPPRATSSVDVHMNEDGIPVPEKEDEPAALANAEAGPSRKPYWGQFPCCLSCTTAEYMEAENAGGIGQEHLQCLNRGTTDTGHLWLEESVRELSEALIEAQTSTGADAKVLDGLPIPYPLNVQLWWGWEDGMVPRKGQEYFNKVILSQPRAISVTIHNVPDGDHTDLMGRREGVHLMYGMIRSQGQTTLKTGLEKGDD